jgi:7-carboxy-7-deazaguanine synthase (Cx14CxxC type)
MSYSVKAIFYTLQGEGLQAGRPAVFCRFAGCNLWSGRAPDRERAICRFCDTDFRGTDGAGGGRYPSAAALASAIAATWPPGAGPTTGDAGDGARRAARARPFVVCTGGEPLLQLDEALIAALHTQGFEIAVETNGTRPAPAGIDWLCVSPKATAPLVLTRGDELKLVYPQPEAPPERFSGLDFKHFLLQPMDGPELARNTARAIDYCKRHPQWRLSLQSHKWLGIP